MRLAEVRNSEKGYFCTPQNPYHNAICIVKEEASRSAPHMDNMTFNTHGKERISICVNLPVNFLCIIKIKKYRLLIIVRKSIKNELHYIGWRAGGSNF
jgi:hypothetical protein